MKSIKCIAQICFQNIRKWNSDYRLWMIAVLLFLLVCDNSRNLAECAGQYGAQASLWSFPFLYQQYHMKLIYMMPLTILFCNAPFMDDNHLFLVARTGKMKWLLGQMLYIIILSGIYFLFIFLCTLITALPDAEFTLEWGKLINTMSYSGGGTQVSPFIEISSMVTTFFTPLSAVWFTFLLSWLCGCMLGMLILCMNMISGKKYLGVLLANGIIVFSCYVSMSLFFNTDFLYPFSPVSWVTLSYVDVGGYTIYPGFYYCITVYLAAILILGACCILWEKRKGCGKCRRASGKRKMAVGSCENERGIERS